MCYRDFLYFIFCYFEVAHLLTWHLKNEALKYFSKKGFLFKKNHEIQKACDILVSMIDFSVTEITGPVGR